MKKAVCVLTKAPDDPFYFAVSRRDNPELWGMPGGKVDEGENLVTAVVRETSEELGIQLDQAKLQPVYTGVCKGKDDGVDYEVTTFYYDGYHPALAVTPEAGLCFGLVSRLELCDHKFSPFADYNQRVFATIDRKVALGLQLNEPLRFYDESSGATLSMDRFYGFADAGGLAGAFEGYDNVLGASVHIKTEHAGDFSYKPEDLGSASICIITGQQYVDQLRELDLANPNHIDTYGRFVK